MKKIFLLIVFFMTISALSQQYSYQIKIKNFDYSFYARSGLCGKSKKIKIEIIDVDNRKLTLYFTRSITNLKRKVLVNKFLPNKVKSIHFYSFIHERAMSGLCDGYEATVDKSENLAYNNNRASGSISGYANGGGEAIINVKFDYEVIPVKKDYNYKVEYDIDLSNQLLFSQYYSTSHTSTLMTKDESKIVYMEQAENIRDTAESIKNQKYDSVVRFKDPLEMVRGNINSRFKSKFSCYDDDSNGSDPNLPNLDDFHFINKNQDNVVNKKGCFNSRSMFPPCNSATVNYFTIYRIRKLVDLDGNKETLKDKADRVIKECEPLRIYVNDCNVQSSYAVEYFVGSDPKPKVLYSYGKKSSYFDVNYNQLQGIQSLQNIHLRVKYYNVDCDKYPYLCSKKVTFTTIDCSPGLAKPIDISNTTCSYNNNGGFKLFFERDLYVGETLVLSLINPEITIIDQKLFTGNLVNEGSGIYSYTWPKELPKGNYELRYQTHYKSEEIDQKDSSWRSLEVHKINISSPNPVSFKIRKLNDETCFKRGDGKIEIYDVNGEKNRAFFYKIDEVNSSDQIIRKIRDWTRFTGKSVIVEKLGSITKGKYKVQVKDEKECYQQEQ